MSASCLVVEGLEHRPWADFLLRVEYLSLAVGEVLAIVGPTGAGKSTLLRLLTGLEPPQQGDIRPGEALAGQAARRAPRVAMVHQQTRLLRGSVREHLQQVQRWQRRDDPTGLHQVLDQLGLTHLASRQTHALSGGQTQLVGVARAIVAAPELLLLDEPTAHLDPQHVQRVEQAVAELVRSRGTSVVWVTHQLFQARRVADRVGLMLDGALVEVAARDTFFDAPHDPRSAAFAQGRMIC